MPHKETIGAGKLILAGYCLRIPYQLKVPVVEGSIVAELGCEQLPAPAVKNPPVIFADNMQDDIVKGRIRLVPGDVRMGKPTRKGILT